MKLKIQERQIILVPKEIEFFAYAGPYHWHISPNRESDRFCDYCGELLKPGSHVIAIVLQPDHPNLLFDAKCWAIVCPPELEGK